MLCERLWHTGRGRAHPVMKDGEADDFKREEDAVRRCAEVWILGFFYLWLNAFHSRVRVSCSVQPSGAMGFHQTWENKQDRGIYCCLFSWVISPPRGLAQSADLQMTHHYEGSSERQSIAGKVVGESGGSCFLDLGPALGTRWFKFPQAGSQMVRLKLLTVTAMGFDTGEPVRLSKCRSVGKLQRVVF